jgi:hypothetical protein
MIENVELVPDKAQAGYALGYADPEYISILPTFRCRSWRATASTAPSRSVGTACRRWPNGSWVTGEYVQNWQTLRDGQPYIVITKEDGIVFKVLYNQAEGQGQPVAVQHQPVVYAVRGAHRATCWRSGSSYTSSARSYPNPT